MIAIPTIETPRLRLRPLAPGDVDAYCTMMADPLVTRFLSDGRPLSREEAWRQLATLIGHWTLRGFGHWAVDDRDTGAFMGRIGCFEPDGWPDFEVAYTLARPFWGRGFASEGAPVALDFARTVLGRQRVTSIIRPGNTGSIRVAEKLGARLERDVPFFGAPAHIYVYPERA